MKYIIVSKIVIMKKGTWVVCTHDDWTENELKQYSIIPRPKELFQVRDFIPGIPGSDPEDRILLEDVKGPTIAFTDTSGEHRVCEWGYRAKAFEEVENLWKFLTGPCQSEQERNIFRLNHQKLLSTLVKKGFSGLSSEERIYWLNAY